MRRSSGRRRCACAICDIDGKEHEDEADGLFATCIQHEIDHLNGVLFIDHISKLKRDRVLEEVRQSGEARRRLQNLPPPSAKRGRGWGAEFAAYLCARFGYAAASACKPRSQADITENQWILAIPVTGDRRIPSLHRASWPLRIAFMGTPEFSVPTLLELHRRGHNIVAVYTRAPKPANRGMKLQPTPVEQEARELKLPVLTPRTLKGDDALATVRSHLADVAVVVAYGLILPQAVLDAFPLGAYNLHASLLPRWRGAPRRSTAPSWRATRKAASWS